MSVISITIYYLCSVISGKNICNSPVEDYYYQAEKAQYLRSISGTNYFVIPKTITVKDIK